VHQEPEAVQAVRPITLLAVAAPQGEHVALHQTGVVVAVVVHPLQELPL
jgi:hypothetical protein